MDDFFRKPPALPDPSPADQVVLDHSGLHGINLTGAVDELTPESSGRWLIHSRTSTHLLDLDERLYLRVPGRFGKGMPSDRQPVRLIRVERWPRVGDQMLVWFDDPSGGLEQWRICATIHAITPAPPHVEQ